MKGLKSLTKILRSHLLSLLFHENSKTINKHFIFVLLLKSVYVFVLFIFTTIPGLCPSCYTLTDIIVQFFDNTSYNLIINHSFQYSYSFPSSTNHCLQSFQCLRLNRNTETRLVLLERTGRLQQTQPYPYWKSTTTSVVRGMSCLLG